MPLEFSVAGFRFGHAMIRPFYQLNPTVQKYIKGILEVSREVIVNMDFCVSSRLAIT